eukprot:CAMPEP_0170543294 /NCGR_PEP_ID=MMETSP0211-20121228/2456_1 /TAXON_ID=311385 /ORGANISM="Pseudokeronopsis sp., Strain OXSARD2" /LENGTH=209 /DNA_ID=CAMNT_0010846629 /DNA_START=553 /DNA_END=1183 /DNA_ORIENTATION=+
MNGKEMKGKQIEVNAHQKKEKRENITQKFNNLFVKNFPKDTTEEVLRDMFKEYGDIDSVSIPKDDNGVNKYFGYVCFKNYEDAERALNALNKKSLGDGQFLIVNQFISKRENELAGYNKISPISQNLIKTFNSNVFIKFIPSEVTEDELKKLFGEVGNIISVKLKNPSRLITTRKSAPTSMATSSMKKLKKPKMPSRDMTIPVYLEADH